MVMGKWATMIRKVIMMMATMEIKCGCSAENRQKRVGLDDLDQANVRVDVKDL